MKRPAVLVMLLGLVPVLAWGGPYVAAPDTMIVTAERENLAAVVAAVGRRMREADQRAAPYSYTAETVRRDRFGPADTTGVTVVYRTVTRLNRDRDGSVRRVILAQSTRRYEDGTLVWESRQQDPGPATWREPARPLLDSLPFAAGAADRYDYQVLQRQLVGNTLLYRIAFSPRNPFDRLPSGEVWVDFAGWVMRRLTAHMDPGTTPTMLLDEVPLYRLEQERRDGLWLPVDVHLVMNLKPSPLVTTPRAMDIRVKITEVAVKGSLDDRHRRLTADGRDPGEFWLDPQAAADSLAVFWAGVDRPWSVNHHVLPGEGPEVVHDDSLVSWADGQLAELAARGRPLRLRIAPQPPRFNRAQGLVPRVKLELGREGAPGILARAAVGLGLADGRLEGAVKFGGGRSPGGRVGWWLGAERQTRAFAVVGERPLGDAAALLYGHDPRHYYQDQRASAGLKWNVGAGFFLEGSVAAYRQRPLRVATRWNVAGVALSPQDNLAADQVKARRLGLGLGLRAGGWSLQGEVAGLTGMARKGLRQLGLDAGWQGMDRGGNAWLLQAHGRRWTHTAPVQDQLWLGDAGSLSGWPAGVLRGNAGVWGSAAVEGAWDPWRSLRVPILGKLRLQPVGLAEVGWTTAPGLWGGGTTAAWSGGPLGSLAMGFQRYLGLPALGGRQKLRLMAAWPVGPGASAQGLRLVLGLTKGIGAP